MYLSGNETVQAPPGDDEKALLKSLIEQAENSSLGTADTQMLASLLTARLAKALGLAQDSSRLVTYGESLADLKASAVLAVFERSRNECRFFSQIAELREMAGALTVQDELMDIDWAWFWVNTYIRKHGGRGEDYVEALPVEGAP